MWFSAVLIGSCIYREYTGRLFLDGVSLFLDGIGLFLGYFRNIWVIPAQQISAKTEFKGGYDWFMYIQSATYPAIFRRNAHLFLDGIGFIFRRNARLFLDGVGFIFRLIFSFRFGFMKYYSYINV